MPNDPTGGGTSDGGLDINSVLGISSPEGDGSGTGDDASQTAQGGSQTQGQTFKFANREYPNQAEAEKQFNKVYGRFSETQGLHKKLTELFKRDPDSLKQLARDPEWAEILGKMGIDAAAREVDERRTQEAQEGPQDWNELRDQISVERAQYGLEREQWKFEKRLGRDITDDEQKQILGIIENSPSLSFEQAYKLAFHDKLLKEAAAKAGKSTPQNINRPRPPAALGLVGEKLNLQKPLSKMTKEEARQAFREDVRAGLAK